MTIDQLEAEAERIAARRADPRTPAVVRRAFAGTPGALTLRRFLLLEEHGSPLLDGRWPHENPEAMGEAFFLAWTILFPGRDIPPAGELPAALEELRNEVARGFSTVMPMKFPSHGPTTPRAEDGLGWVARLIARAVGGLHLDLDAALDLPMDRLFVLTAALAHEEGADCAGEDYRDREAGLQTTPHPDRHSEPEQGRSEQDQQCQDSQHN